MEPKKEEKVKNPYSSKEDYFKKYPRHKVELTRGQMVEMDFPAPSQYFRLVMESFSASIEEAYYWVLNTLRYDAGYSQVHKITDIFAASEHSSFFGVSQQRLGLQQDKISQNLAVVGKMVKELFQMVRELRIIDERKKAYEDSYSPDKKNFEPAEITLKGWFVDMAEGGSKNPASVFGMARELQFTTLPDLFFSVHPKTPDKVDATIDALEFNENVKRVLKRKLYSFLRWKEETFKEIVNRRGFMVKYLRQHWEVIRMYMTWVKPYLKNLKRLGSNDSMLDSPDLVSAFEGSMLEIEILATQMPEGNKSYQACVVANFQYRTRPSMNYTQEGYNRGPLHIGQIDMSLRGYAWDDKDIANYKFMRDIEDIELLSSIDESVKSAMDLLGEDFERYIREAGGELEKDREKSSEPPKPPPSDSALDPFISVFKGFGELFGALAGSGGSSSGSGKGKKKPTAQEAYLAGLEKGKAKKTAKSGIWATYKNFKKAHRMVTW